MPTLIINGQEINEYTYKLNDPRNVFTQPKEVTGVDIDELLAEARNKETALRTKGRADQSESPETPGS